MKANTLSIAHPKMLAFGMLWCALLLTSPAMAQEAGTLTLSQEMLDLYNAQRAELNRKGMAVLIGRTGVNIVSDVREQGHQRGGS